MFVHEAADVSLWRTSGLRHEISGKQGNTPVRTLRKIYGQGFATEYPDTAQLSEVMPQLNATSPSQLRRDHETHQLRHKIAHVAE